MNAKENELETLNLKQTTLEQEQMRVLFNSIPLSLGISIFIEVILSASHWNVIGHGELIIWNVLLLGSVFLRVISWLFWRNTRQNLSAIYWLNIFRVGTLLGGAAWGSTAIFIFAHYNPTYQALLAFTLAGVATGSLTTLAIDKYSAIIFVTASIFPLSARLFMEHGATAVPMAIMTLSYIIFVISASTRARNNLEEHFKKNAQLINWSKERIQQQKLSKAIGKSQALFINDGNARKTFEQLLGDITEITESKFGFIGEVFYDKDAKPYLKMQAISNIAWDQESSAMYERHKTDGMEFHSLNSLFGTAIVSGRPIISNAPAQDMRAGSKPHGHPPLTAFLGIPIFSGTTLVAMIGLANKADGYDEELIEFLKPMLSSIAQFIIAIRHNRRHQEDEAKLKYQAHHTQTILDEAFDAIITSDKAGKIISFNHAAEIIFGYRANQIIGENITKLMPEPHRSKHIDYANEHQEIGLAKAVGIGREITGLRRNGKEFPLELAVSEIVENGEPIYIGIARDISERKHTETLKNQFIATVSHELRTPLTSISASLAIIESGSLGKLPEKISNLTRIAHQNSLRLQRLINDLLDMDKLLTNTIELNTKIHSATELAEAAILENQYYAEKYHVKFELVRSSPDIHIYADGERVTQVLGNLLSNAAKYSNPHMNVDVVIAQEDSFVKFSVIDYGAGIPMDFNTQIFQSFSQADGSTTRLKDGSGLGLAISKEFVEKMGGKIGFTSSVGQGSCFYFTLPSAKPIDLQ